ncbi:radical SAM protein [Desulfovibrionales bacterium]
MKSGADIIEQPHNHTMFRPPAEKDSVLLRVADGCPHNSCAFCGMYRGVRYRMHELMEVQERIARAAAHNPLARRVFLADGDALALPDTHVLAVLDLLARAFPRLTRVSCYASGHSIRRLTEKSLRLLRAARLRTLYMGLESGSEAVLQQMGKRDSASDMILACQRAQSLGLVVSVMVLLGAGGAVLSAEHVAASARAVNAMQPKMLSCLRLVPVPGTPLWNWVRSGRFALVSEAGAVRELYQFVAALDLHGTVFRADHSSNSLPVAGRLPADKARLMDELREALDAGIFDEKGPGMVSAL